MIRLRTPQGERLEIREMIGDSKPMSAVYRGSLQHVGDVAVKILNQDGRGNRKSWEQWKYRNEAYCAKRLKHFVGAREVLRSYAIDSPPRGLNAGNACWVIVYEFVEETLRQMLDRQGPLTVSQLHDLTQALGESLTTIHGHGIIHRDINPANILIVGEQTKDAKIADFGLCLHKAAWSREHARTQVGTPGYVLPDSSRWSRTSRGVDIYSFACVIWEAASGRRPTLGGWSGSSSRHSRLVECEYSRSFACGGRKAPRLGKMLVDTLSCRKRPGRSAAEFGRNLIRAGVRDGLWDSLKAPRQRRSSKNKRRLRSLDWPHADYRRNNGGSLWFYIGRRHERALTAASPPGTHWTYVDFKGGFYTKDERVNPKTVLKKATAARQRRGS